MNIDHIIKAIRSDEFKEAIIKTYNLKQSDYAHGGVSLNNLQLNNKPMETEKQTLSLTQKRVTEIHNELRRQRAAKDAEIAFIKMLENDINYAMKMDSSAFSYTQTLNYTTTINTKKKQIKSAQKRIARHETIISSLEFSLKYQ